MDGSIARKMALVAVALFAGMVLLGASCKQQHVDFTAVCTVTLITPQETRVLPNQDVTFQAHKISTDRRSVDSGSELATTSRTDNSGKAYYQFGYNLDLDLSGHNVVQGARVKVWVDYGGDTYTATAYGFPYLLDETCTIPLEVTIDIR